MTVMNQRKDLVQRDNQREPFNLRWEKRDPPTLLPKRPKTIQTINKPHSVHQTYVDALVDENSHP
jgi:hypothetical protein